MTENAPATIPQAPPQVQPAGPPKKPTMVDQLKTMLPEIQRSLPKHMSGDRFTRIVLTEMRKTPKLAQTTPESFFGSLMTASAIGLEPGVNGECWLVPYENKKARIVECQLIIGYQGVVKLFWQHPLAKRIAAETVYANDHFRISKGLVQALDHEPAQGDRGEVVGYWALAELTTGGMNFDYFSAEEIRAIRRSKVGSSGDIPDPQHWMERKTAIKQVLKLMPKSAHLAAAIDADEQPGSMHRGEIALHINPDTGEVLDPEPEA